MTEEMISPDTGTIDYAPGFQLGRETAPSKIPSQLLRNRQSWNDTAGRPWEAIHLHPGTDPFLHLTLRFCDGKLFSAEFFANIFRPDSDWKHWMDKHWTDKELERKRYHDELLAKWLGSQTKFEWGTVWSTYDSKGGFSVFGIIYS
jgi:hypothetical protein